MERKLIFIETKDVVETTLALDNFRRACDTGRGAIFFSVARYFAEPRFVPEAPMSRQVCDMFSKSSDVLKEHS